MNSAQRRARNEARHQAATGDARASRLTCRTPPKPSHLRVVREPLPVDHAALMHARARETSQPKYTITTGPTDAAPLAPFEPEKLHHS